jgi:hypothetical protein
MAVRKLWQRRLTDGAEISAALFHDREEREATAEITVRSAHAEDALATQLADAIKKRRQAHEFDEAGN